MSNWMVEGPINQDQRDGAIPGMPSVPRLETKVVQVQTAEGPLSVVTSVKSPDPFEEVLIALRAKQSYTALINKLGSTPPELADTLIAQRFPTESFVTAEGFSNPSYQDTLTSPQTDNNVYVSEGNKISISISRFAGQYTTAQLVQIRPRPGIQVRQSFCINVPNSIPPEARITIATNNLYRLATIFELRKLTDIEQFKRDPDVALVVSDALRVLQVEPVPNSHGATEPEPAGEPPTKRRKESFTVNQFEALKQTIKEAIDSQDKGKCILGRNFFEKIHAAYPLPPIMIRMLNQTLRSTFPNSLIIDMSMVTHGWEQETSNSEQSTSAWIKLKDQIRELAENLPINRQIFVIWGDTITTAQLESMPRDIYKRLLTALSEHRPIPISILTAGPNCFYDSLHQRDHVNADTAKFFNTFLGSV